ncbi:MAG: tRNA pseudouridine38-40 synthase [Actinomycetota bacterium]|nr:tRNA pseudouridine38-40 synthase [Actinomycetota bacterium]
MAQAPVAVTVRLDVAYDGTAFRGWAAQGGPAIRTIEAELTAHLERVVQVPVKLSVAGRTDAGVHARGQVASFKTTSRVTPERLQHALNSVLAPEVVITRAAHVPERFDARFSATSRVYRYVIRTGEVSDPFTGRYEWHRPKPLRLTSMRRAARSVVGEHDFTTFCRHPGEGKGTVRDLQQLSITRDGDLIVFVFRANAFLHQMVRALVGTLVMVGEGRIVPEEVAGMLSAKDRTGTPNVAPAMGLTLERVAYART